MIQWKEIEARDLADGEREIDYEGKIDIDGEDIFCNASAGYYGDRLLLTYSVGEFTGETYTFTSNTANYPHIINYLNNVNNERDIFMTAGIIDLCKGWEEKKKLDAMYLLAMQKAEIFLRTFLTKKQRRMWRGKYGHFYEKGPLTGWTYKFSKRTTGVDVVVKKGNRHYAPGRSRYTVGYSCPKPYFCLHSDDLYIPDADITIAQLLLIRSDEAEFLAQANWHSDIETTTIARRERNSRLYGETESMYPPEGLNRDEQDVWFANRISQVA